MKYEVRSTKYETIASVERTMGVERSWPTFLRTSYFVLRTSAAPLAFLLGWRVLTLLFAVVASQFGAEGPPAGLGEVVARTLDRWDAGWYLAIAKEGYSIPPGAPGQSNVAFYPLLPLLIRIVYLVVPSWRLAGALVVHAALAGAVLYLDALVRLDHDRRTGLRAVVALLLYPTAVFLTAIYTESLLLLALLGAVYHARRGQWWAAGLWGLVAGLTKTVGVVALVPIVWEYWRAAPWRGVRWRARLAQVAPLALIPLGAVAYLGYLRLRFGTVQVYFDTQTVWYRRGGFQPFLTDGPEFLRAFLRGEGEAVVNYFYPPGAATLPSAGAFMLLDLAFILIAFIVGLAITFRLRASYGLLVLAGAVLTAYSGSPQSLNRYTLILFPIPIACAIAARRPALGFALLTLSGLLSVYHLYLFVNGLWAG
jgi:hypothetical protein